MFLPTAAALFPVAKRCSRPSKKTASSGRPMPRLSWSHPYQSPWLRRPSARPDCKEPGPLGPLPLVRPVLDAGHRSRLLGSGVPHLSQGPQPLNEGGARGALAHTRENVPPGARAEALNHRPRAPLLLLCREGRHGVASRSLHSSPSPWEILPLEPRSSVP